uniref:Putative secreted protein n=1 Tax=Ixodes ricinus TaxID=34613 RepID=A0A6B0UXZ5_IXORI
MLLQTGFSRAAMLLRTGLPLATKALLLPGSRCLRSPYDVAQVRRSAIPGAVAPMIGHHEGLVDWTSTLLPRGLAGRSLLHHPGCLGKRPNPYSRPVGLLGNTMWNGYSREVSVPWCLTTSPPGVARSSVPPSRSGLAPLRPFLPRAGSILCPWASSDGSLWAQGCNE